MKKILAAFLLIACVLAHAEETTKPDKDDDKPIVRAARVSEGGMSLYSWHDTGSDEWRFALIPAPSVEKLKSPAEVATKENTIEGVPALKRKLSALALNEKVGWFNMLERKGPAPENLVFAFPSRETIKDLELLCTVLKVRLNIYLSNAKK